MPGTSLRTVKYTKSLPITCLGDQPRIASCLLSTLMSPAWKALQVLFRALTLTYSFRDRDFLPLPSCGYSMAERLTGPETSASLQRSSKEVVVDAFDARACAGSVVWASHPALASRAGWLLIRAGRFQRLSQGSPWLVIFFYGPAIYCKRRDMLSIT
jgi:hypothetical protein